jgi:hypothetical protein
VQNLSTSFILGYHGCDQQVGEDLLLNKPFEPSQNDYDWLGSGIYFWEANPSRGLAWAKELEGQPIYETSGFHEKTHIQICVRNPKNIKGVFRVPADQFEIG